MKKHLILPLIALAALLATSCEEDEFTEPSFIHLESIILQPNDNHLLFNDPGMLTSDIVAAYVVAHRPGASKVDTIGLFELPFTVPILYQGELDYIDFYPAIQQSGSSLALPFYTFYHRIRHEGGTLVKGATLDFGTDTTTYNLTREDMRIFVPFEPPASDIYFDSVMQWATGATADACTGQGYGYVHVPADRSYVDFALEPTITVTDPTKLVYLELDTRSDMDFEVYMNSRYDSGGAIDKQPVMVVRKSSTWKHLYINLGKTWAYFNHYKDFTLSFSALNENGVEGDIRLDNVRVLTTSVVL
ncbi:MAG: hypothetical protein J6V98_03870 [Bacteroidales bacterium]|nr:hypothetical protein [Bacteroidales bacterium]